MKRRYRSLADYMDQTGTTQGALAKRLGVDHSYVSYLAAGKRTPALPIAIRIVKITGVPLESLIADSDRVA